MLVKQVSAFIENKAGRLNEIADTLAASNIDISALSLADTTDYGIVRMIVSDPETAILALRESGVVCKITDTLAIAIDDRPGGFAKGLKLLTDNDFEIKYMYACISHAEGKALMIVSVDNPEAADKIIASTHICEVDPSEIYRHI